MGRKQDQRIAEIIGKPLADRFEVEASKIAESNRRVEVRLEAIQRYFEITADDANTLLLERSGIHLPKEIDKMDEPERIAAVCILGTLFSLSDKPTVYQKDFLLSVKNRLKVTHRQMVGVDILDAIDLVKNIDDRLAILYTILTFLFLGSLDYRYLDEYNDIIFSFGIQKKKILNALADIESVYQKLGVEALVKDYGPAKEYDREEQKTIRSFNIALICNKKDKAAVRTCDMLSALLVAIDNSCKVCSPEDDQRGISGNFDKKIYIGQNDRTKTILGTGKITSIINQYGCFVGVTKPSSNILVIYNDPKYNFNEGREEFICFVKRIAQDGEPAKKLNKLVEDKNRKQEKLEGECISAKLFEGIGNFISEGFDKMSCSDHVLVKILSVVYGVVGTVTLVASGILSVLGVIGEQLTRLIIEQLNNSNFDSKYVAAAQEQVLIQKTAQLIRAEQER